MCTTYLATELIREFGEFDLLEHPRLVRLNPNVPWKTRGNGAIALKLGNGSGRPKTIGELDGKPVECFPSGTNTKPTEGHYERACRVIEDLAMFEDANTNPGLIMTSRKPPQALYWGAVREVVDLKRHMALAKPEFSKGWKNNRGLIGAISAVAWRPRAPTHELIAYREQIMWGKPRNINEASVRKMDRAFPTTFNNYDYEEMHMVIAPASPCPILYGIRGDKEQDLPEAAAAVRSERIARHMIFLTNQGTDDHITRTSISRLEPFTSVSVIGNVTSAPRTIKGGHLIFSLSNGHNVVDCTIYEPAKSFRRIGEVLVPGDRLLVMGGVREKPFTINVEKVRIQKLANVREKVANPMCPKCSKRMKSIGKDQGYRCSCGKKVGENEAEFRALRRAASTGWYEPPVGSRRHLSKPLKRM